MSAHIPWHLALRDLQLLDEVTTNVGGAALLFHEQAVAKISLVIPVVLRRSTALSLGSWRLHFDRVDMAYYGRLYDGSQVRPPVITVDGKRDRA